MINNRKIDKIIKECYVELYKNSIPSADFNSLFENANVDINGRKEIDFMNYTISEEIASKIINNIAKKYKLSKLDTKKFKVSIYLGCSPKFSLQS